MPDRYLESHIRRNPLFQNLAPQEFDLVTKAFQVLRFGRGEIVVKQGNPTQGLFIFVDGGGVLTQQQPDGTQRRVGVVQENDVLDHQSLFQEGVEPLTLRTTDESTVLFLSRNRMNTVLSYYPEVRNRLGTPQRTRTQTQTAATVQATDDQQEQAAPARRQPPEPAGYNIQRENEEIVLVRRRHPWVFVRRGWLPAVLLMLAFAASVAILNTELPAALCFAPVTIVGLLSAGLMTYYYLEWRNDSFVVTDTRVIRIERVIPTFSVHINEIPLNRVQEVNSELPEGDIFARIFRYGNVELKNASDAGDMVLDYVPNPDDVQEAIFANQARRREMADENKRSAIRAEIEKQLGLGNTVQNAAQSANAPAEAAAPPVMDEVSYEPARTYSWSPARMQFTSRSGDTVYRKHVTVWLAAIAAPSAMIFGALVLMILSLLGASEVPLLGPVGFLVSVALLIVGGLWFWWSDWDWRNDMYILSDDRVTLIHRRPLWLQNKEEQVLLNRVDNVISDMSGLVDTIFQRGDVKLSLVGEGIDRAKVFEKVHKPHEIQAELSRRQARAKALEEQNRDLRQRESIKEYLSVYHETVQGTGGQPQQQQQPPTAPPPPVNRPPNPSGGVEPYQSPDRSRPPGIPRNRRNPPT